MPRSRRSWFEASLMQISQKTPSQISGGRVVQVIEYLLSKCEVLTAHPSDTKKKKIKSIKIKEKMNKPLNELK
jgi:hypothetical protein